VVRHLTKAPYWGGAGHAMPDAEAGWAAGREGASDRRAER
jgi:hypothetical protein